MWISSDPKDGEPGAPHFGGADAIYNVIDARQNDPQNNGEAALLLDGIHEAEAAHYTHFSYEMVAMTPRCAEELGYASAEEDQQRSVHRGERAQGIRREGRRPAGQADRGGARARWTRGIRRSSAAERREIATQIAVGALRYFMLRFTKHR